jgi:hypothetical protein
MDDERRRQFLRLGSLSAATLVAGCGRILGDPPSPTVADARTESTSPVVGAPVTVSATVSNPAGTEQDHTVELLVDGTAVATRTVTVSGDAEQTVTFTHRFDAPGEYDVAVGEATVGTVSVSPAVTVESVRLEHERVATGAPVSVVASVVNAAPGSRERTFALTADGEEVATRTVELAGTERTVDVAVGFDAPGERTVAVAGIEAGTVTVTDSWRQFGYGPANTGRPVDLTGPTGDVETVWRYDAMEGSSSVPAVVGDTVYWGTGNPYAAADRGSLMALSADDGSVEWTVDAGGRANATPAVAHDTVVTTTATGEFGDDDATGSVVGVEAGSGDWLWSLDLGGYAAGSPAAWSSSRRTTAGSWR